MENKLNAFFSRDDINTSRQVNIDFAKCMAIIFMVICHVFMYPEYKDLYTGFAGVIYGYFGGFLAAPVFMISMGVGLCFTRNQDPNSIIKRGIKLFVIAYIVNVIRCISPFIGLVMKYDFNDALRIILLHCFEGDILHFAGLALITYGLVKKTKLNSIWLFVISLVIGISFSFIPNIDFESHYLASFLGLFIPILNNGTIPSAFPLLTWFVFVSFGVLFGEIVRKVRKLDRFYLFVIIIGAVLFATFFSIEFLTEFGTNKIGYDAVEYYNPYTLMIFSIGSTMVVYGVFYFLSKITPTKFDQLCFKMSSCVNEIYIISWIIIMDIFNLFAGILFPKEYDFWFYMLFGILITIISVVLGYYWSKLKKQHRKKVKK